MNKILAHVLVMWLVVASAAAQDYEFGTVLIGGGGYVTGIRTHPKDPNVVYIRTDVGGCYRYDPDAQIMRQLMDWVPIKDKNLYGIAGLALNPVKTNELFAAAGKYPFAQPSDVLYSADHGSTFVRLGLNQPFGGNRHPEKLGRRLVFDPTNLNHLYCGTYEAGVYRYDRKTESWSKLETLPKDANIMSIQFDPAEQGHLFVATRWDGIYRSANGGSTFMKIPASPTNIADMVLGPEHNLFVATIQDGLFRLRSPAKADEWVAINPPTDIREFRAIGVDPHVPGRIAAVPKMMNGLNDALFLSVDAGNSWTKLDCQVEQIIPWHRTDFPGSAVSRIEFDASRKNVVYVTDWFSVYRTMDITADTVFWSNRIAKGHEEVVCLNMAAPPDNKAGVHLYSMHADITGFTHTDVNAYPKPYAQYGQTRELNNITGLAFCEAAPNVVYILGSTDHDGEKAGFAVSHDFGKTWTLSPSYDSDWHWGRVAVSATDPDRIVIATENGGVRFSTNGGQTWQQAEYAGHTGLDGPVFRYNHPLTADRVDGHRFYMYDQTEGIFYRSEDGGESWDQTATRLPDPYPDYFRGLDKKYWRLLSVPNHAGHLLLALADCGLFKSTDGGSTWTRLETVAEAPLVAAGASMPGATYPAIFILGKVQDDKELWYYRSDDGGKTWVRVNNRHHRLGNEPEVLEADRQIPGRYYIGMNGTGVKYGQPVGEKK